ncbi:hypothetical protein K505DRAFT_338493 [Melanomma pulvis-pyrius CBS 109.77]|uniref:MYND-type domain-containing protein n=1 Tax=Melanomma pulvis-pyrius CBS 109.77 TaxID=1314802 RepID=A0A6A6X843_9PLEO|nr:hypothetical protein K505DRAFT_338493 [Melanomma pulvis-pyrius CBS 109.77]
MVEDARTKCSYCGEPATLKCGGCKIDVYCGTDCQKLDWASHKTTCKEISLERTIERCADTLQRAYLDFREITYDSPIAKVEVKNDRIYIYDGPISMRKNGIFADFPNHLITERSVKMAVLCFLMCNEPIALFAKLLSTLLTHLKLKIEEVSVSLQNVPRKTIVVYPNGYEHHNFPGHKHEIFCVTSVKSGKKWAIDLAGGQYGLCQPCWRWEEYEKRYVEEVITVHLLGTNETYVKACSQVEGTPSLTRPSTQDAASHLKAAFHKWVETLPAGLPKMLILDDEKFKYHQDCLLKDVNAAVRKFVDNSNYTTEARKAARYERDNPGVSSQRLQDIRNALFQRGYDSSPRSTAMSMLSNLADGGGDLNLDLEEMEIWLSAGLRG